MVTSGDQPFLTSYYQPSLRKSHIPTILAVGQSFVSFKDTFDDQPQLSKSIDHIRTLYRYVFDVALLFKLFHVERHY